MPSTSAPAHVPPGHVPRVPTPRVAGHPVIGSALTLRRDPLGTLTAAERVGPVVRIDVGPPGWRQVLHGVFHPDGVERVLVADPHRLTKQSPMYQELRRALGDGLFTSEGERWKRQRRVLAPALTRRRVLGSYAPMAVTEMTRVADRWAAAADAGETVGARDDMVDFTVRFIGRVLVGADVEFALPVVRSTVPALNRSIMRRGLAAHRLPFAVPTPTNRRMAAAVEENERLVAELVRRRRAAAEGDDLVGLLLRTGELDDAEVADQVMTFLFAGHETTATTLAIALHRLAVDPVLQEALRAEVDAVAGDRPPTAADLPGLVGTDHVVREVLRLWPSAPSTARVAPVEDEVLGHRIPAGATVLLSPYATQRSARWWPEPQRFDPGRFADPLPGGHRWAWFPFGAGAHACVGMHLALMEAVLGLATLLQRVEWTTEETSVATDVGIVLRPAGPVPLAVRRRRRE